eukprot:11210662-Lingulodinium_polyedra.AAC.1
MAEGEGTPENAVQGPFPDKRLTEHAVVTTPARPEKQRPALTGGREYLDYDKPCFPCVGQCPLHRDNGR